MIWKRIKPDHLLGRCAELSGPNLLRDDIQKEIESVLSLACKEPAVVGTAVVSRPGYPDSHAFDKRSKYYDAKSDPDNPRWYMVDVKLEEKFDVPSRYYSGKRL